MPGSSGSRREFFSLRRSEKVPEKKPGKTPFPFSRDGLQRVPIGSSLPAPMKPILLPILALSITLAMPNSAKAQLKVGDNAPEVSGVTDSGQTLKFSDVYAKQTYTLVYFYPKADTPGCTAQGCSIRDGYESLTSKGVAVIGVSHDDVAAQKAFKEKYHLPFTLVADTDDKVIGSFGVETYPGGMAHRNAYLIKGGKIIYTDYKGTTKTQAETILGVIAADKS
jgi:peroxiredoxin Q/BCP